MKFQDGAGGDSDGGDDWVLTKSGSRMQTDETQNRSEGTAHGLGLSPHKNASNTIILSSLRDAVNAKRRNA